MGVETLDSKTSLDLRTRLEKRRTDCFTQRDDYLQGHIDNMSYHTWGFANPRFVNEEDIERMLWKEFYHSGFCSCRASWYIENQLFLFRSGKLSVSNFRGKGFGHAEVKGEVKLYQNGDSYNVELFLFKQFIEKRGEYFTVPALSISPNKQLVQSFAVQNFRRFSIYSQDKEGGEFSIHLKSLSELSS